MWLQHLYFLFLWLLSLFALINPLIIANILLLFFLAINDLGGLSELVTAQAFLRTDLQRYTTCCHRIGWRNLRILKIDHNPSAVETDHHHLSSCFPQPTYGITCLESIKWSYCVIFYSYDIRFMGDIVTCTKLNFLATHPCGQFNRKYSYSVVSGTSGYRRRKHTLSLVFSFVFPHQLFLLRYGRVYSSTSLPTSSDLSSFVLYSWPGWNGVRLHQRLVITHFLCSISSKLKSFWTALSHDWIMFNLKLSLARWVTGAFMHTASFYCYASDVHWSIKGSLLPPGEQLEKRLILNYHRRVEKNCPWCSFCVAELSVHSNV